LVLAEGLEPTLQLRKKFLRLLRLPITPR